MRRVSIVLGFCVTVVVVAALHAAQGTSQKTIVPEVPADKDAGFTSIFDGKTLKVGMAIPTSGAWRTAASLESLRQAIRHPAVSSSGVAAGLRTLS